MFVESCFPTIIVVKFGRVIPLCPVFIITLTMGVAVMDISGSKTQPKAVEALDSDVAKLGQIGEYRCK